MTKFSEMAEAKRASLLTFYLEILRIKAQEDQDLNKFGVRILLLTNAAGLAATVTFIGVLVQAGKHYQAFIGSLTLFLAGAACAVLVQLIFMSVTSYSINQLGS